MVCAERARNDPPICAGTVPSGRSVEGAQNGEICAARLLRAHELLPVAVLAHEVVADCHRVAVLPLAHAVPRRSAEMTRHAGGAVWDYRTWRLGGIG